jgi:DNA mismatch repair protein MutL
MAAADLPLAVEEARHLQDRELEDLSRVVSLGFRGEALHALATVARVRIVTPTGSTPGARELLVEGAWCVELRDAAGDAGTLVEVTGFPQPAGPRGIFGRVPLAGRRAIRQEVLEKMLAWPDRALNTLGREKKVYASPAGNLQERGSPICMAATWAGGSFPVAAEESGMALAGFIAPAERHSALRHDRCSS